MDKPSPSPDLQSPDLPSPNPPAPDYPVSTVTIIIFIVAFILLLLVGLSLPIIEHIHLITFQPAFNNPASASVATLQFGTWGVCAYSAPNQDPSLRNSGYCIDPQLKYTIPTEVRAQFHIPDNVVNAIEASLLPILVFHPIAAGLALFAIIPSVIPASFWASICAFALALIAALLGTTVFGIDLALVIIARQRLKGSEFDVEFGNGVWMVLAASLALWEAARRSFTRILNSKDDEELANWTRCLLFIVMEGLFIAAASALYANPISLPYQVPDSLGSSSSSNLIKSTFSTISILWHTIAGFVGGGVISDAYSREWKHREKKGANGTSKSPGSKEKIDSVCTLKAGWPDRITHFRHQNSVKPSKAFRVALFASVWMLLLSQFGPPTIVVDNGMGTPSLDVGGLILGTSQRTHSILTVERVMGLRLGFGTQPNWIIPKPANTPPGSGFEYSSDLIYFNNACQWLVPQFSNISPAVGRVLIGNESFYFTRFKAPPNSTMLDTTIPGTAVYSLRPSSPSSTFAFVIFGGNSTHPLNSDSITRSATTSLSVVGVPATGNTIDLSGLPTLYNASWFNFSGDRFKASDGRSLVFRAPLATALYCNPSAGLTTGRVRLASNNLTVQVASPLFPREHNIDEGDIPQYFSWALDGVGNAIDSYVSTIDSTFTQSQLLVDFTALAQRLLLPDNAGSSNLSNASVPPLSLHDIGTNMDAFVLSASKAQQVDGRVGVQDSDIPSGSGMQRLRAEGPLPQQVLASSLPWLLLTALSAFVVFVSCCYITYRIDKKRNERPPFELVHIRDGFVPLSQPC